MRFAGGVVMAVAVLCSAICASDKASLALSRMGDEASVGVLLALWGLWSAGLWLSLQ